MRPSPEEIEEKRRQRQLKKAQAAANAPQKPLEYIQRPFLQVKSRPEDKLLIRVMSYNVLAQALVRRHLFPTSGTAIKWLYRGPVIADEVKHYDCDVICFQEVDVGSTLIDSMNKLGYVTKFHSHPQKRHGQLIAFKKLLFKADSCRFLDYDEDKEIEGTVITQNVGQIIELKFTDDVTKQYEYLQLRRLLIGTTHLYWHPYGCFERTRQTAIVKQTMVDFERDLRLIDPSIKYYKIFAGDFNLEPFDPPYMGLVQNPFDEEGLRLLKRSVNHFCNRVNQDKEDEEPVYREPSDPQYRDVEPLIEAVKEVHFGLTKPQLTSAYSSYVSVDPENSQVNGEPPYSNWAHAWRGLLDYIFLFDGSDITVCELLKMPTKKELGDAGLPQKGKYPSDHLCIAATLCLE